jgi:tRNA pseudouridine38-40 synthase
MRYAMALEYDGSPFMGWQKHDTGDTIQGAVEKAVSFVADAPVEVVCSGRTDARVSARCQVVHFDSDAPRDARAWVLGTNTRLPDSIRALWLQPVSDDFHARYSARARRYRYSLLIRAVKPAIGRQFLSWSREDLDVARMHDAAQKILGEQDFSAFRTVQCQAKHPNRNLHRLDVSREGDTIYFDVQANAFLHHMVRNLVGSLVEVGRGAANRDGLHRVLASGDRTLAARTFPARGLCLERVEYDPSL